MSLTAFISYSHKDAAYLDRLHTHLSVLKREGKIGSWYDRDILVGDEVDAAISSELDRCDLFLALVSPDYLASNYCYDREMQTAIERHDAGKSRLVPIILEPCDWQATPLKKLKATPRDGKPISDWQNPNTAFLDIVGELRRIAEAQPASSIPASVPTDGSPKEARRYRTKRDFDKIDRADFKKESFDAIKKYLRASIVEIDGIENIKARFADIGPYSFSCTILNTAKSRGMGAVTVHMQSDGHGMGDIYYSNTENAPANTSNGGFTIEADEYELFLTPSYSFSSKRDQRMTAIQAAETLWTQLLEQAGVSYV